VAFYTTVEEKKKGENWSHMAQHLMEGWGESGTDGRRDKHMIDSGRSPNVAAVGHTAWAA
jgi:hypothetical protein